MTNHDAVSFSSDDARMEAAIDHAKSTINQFFDAFCNPSAKRTSFLLKVVFDEGDQREHIWLADLQLSEGMPTGVIANEPGLPSLNFLQRVEFAPRYISDWMYVEDGRLVGGFTTRVIRARMTTEQRAELDARSPYRF